MIEQRIQGEGASSIAQSIEGLIREQALSPGEQIPTVRALADELSVSPATVSAAYRILKERGFIISQGRGGTIVSYAPAIKECRKPCGVDPEAYDLASGNPDPSFIPDHRPYLKKITSQAHLYGEETNISELTELIRDEYHRDKLRTPRIAIVNGALEGVRMLLASVSRPGDRVLIEDPCYDGVVDIVRMLGLTPIPVAVDAFGIQADSLAAGLQKKAVALIVTPRAQNPTGAAFNERRVKELAEVLGGHAELLLIEDDHCHRIAGVPYVSLAAEVSCAWAVVRSVSKSLGPDLRVAFIGASESVLSRVEGQQALGCRWVSHILQEVVLRMLKDKRLMRHLEKVEKAYRDRREALLMALRERGFAPDGRSGMNIWLPAEEESPIVQGLSELGYAVRAGERYRLRSKPGIRITSSQLDEATPEAFGEALSSLFSRATRSSLA